MCATDMYADKSLANREHSIDVVGRVADPVAATDFLHLGVGIGLFQDRYDLALRESALLHRCLLAG